MKQDPSPERDDKPNEGEEKKETDTSDSLDSGFPDDAFLMATQLQWEDDVIWDGSEIKHKVLCSFQISIFQIDVNISERFFFAFIFRY